MKLGHRGLALSTSIVALVNFFLLYIMMRRHAGRLETNELFKTLVKVLTAGVVLAGICLLALLFWFNTTSLPLWRKVIELAVTIALGVVSFFGSAFLLRVNEVHDLVELVRRRFSRKGI
jgi:putative peptidoglycan lipid II flippase